MVPVVGWIPAVFHRILRIRSLVNDAQLHWSNSWCQANGVSKRLYTKAHRDFVTWGLSFPICSMTGLEYIAVCETLQLRRVKVNTVFCIFCHGIPLRFRACHATCPVESHLSLGEGMPWLLMVNQFCFRCFPWMRLLIEWQLLLVISETYFCRALLPQGVTCGVTLQNSSVLSVHWPPPTQHNGQLM